MGTVHTLLIDNYDSFSYNLYQYIGEIDPDVQVIRNDAYTVDQIREMNPERIILSPGPGRPEDAGVIIDVVKELGAKFPILGVCLGHQAICTAYGGVVTYADKMMHGKQSEVTLMVDCPVFERCPIKTEVARYHSLIAKADTIPSCLTVTASTSSGEVMAVMHKDYPVYGLQFHPESIMTPMGMRMIENFCHI